MAFVAARQQLEALEYERCVRTGPSFHANSEGARGAFSKKQWELRKHLDNMPTQFQRANTPMWYDDYSNAEVLARGGICHGDKLRRG